MISVLKCSDIQSLWTLCERWAPGRICAILSDSWWEKLRKVHRKGPRKMFNFYLIDCIYLYTYTTYLYIIFTLYTIYISIYTYILSLSWDREGLRRDEEFPDWIPDHHSWYWRRDKKIKDGLKMAPISQSFLLWTGVFYIHCPWIRAAPWRLGPIKYGRSDAQLVSKLRPSQTSSFWTFPPAPRATTWQVKTPWRDQGLAELRLPVEVADTVDPPKQLVHQLSTTRGPPTQHFMEQINCPVVSWALTTFLTEA